MSEEKTVVHKFDFDGIGCWVLILLIVFCCCARDIGKGIEDIRHPEKNANANPLPTEGGTSSKVATSQPTELDDQRQGTKK